MNHRGTTALLFLAAASAFACLSAARPTHAQAPSGPVAPLNKMEFKTVDPLGGAKLPSPAPGTGATSYPRPGKRPGSDFYSSSDFNRKAGARSGASGYSAPGTSRQPIRAGKNRGAQYPSTGSRGGGSNDIPNIYR